MAEKERLDKSSSVGTGGRWAPVATEVLEGVRRRDRESLGHFFDQVFPFVYSLAIRWIKDRGSAEDVTQEVFLKVHRAADRLDPNRSPYPWLSTITVNTCRDWARARSRRGEEPIDEQVIQLRHDGAPDAHESMVRKEQVRMLEKALASLDRGQREVVLLHDYCGCKHEEIATLVGASLAAVRKRYSRALESIRTRLREWEA